MRVLFLNTIGRDVWGGGEKWMLAAAAGLRARKHAVFLAGRAHGELLARAAELGFPVTPLRVRGDFNVWAAARLAALFRREAIDLVVANFNRDVRLAGLARGLARRPLIVARNGLPILHDNWRYRLTYRRLVAGIVTNARAIRERYLRYGWIPEDFVKVIPNGIDPALARRADSALTAGPADPEAARTNGAAASRALRERLGIACAAPVVGIFGRLVPQKRHDLFLEAARHVAVAQPAARFLIVGDGPGREALLARAAELGLGARLCFAGFQRDVFPYLAVCDVVALSSDDEGLPNAVMEAMLAGRCVVAFSVGGVPELLGEGAGVLIAPRDAQSMGREIAKLIADEPRRTTLAARGRERILEEFTLDRMVERLEAYLLDLLGKKSRRQGG